MEPDVADRPVVHLSFEGPRPQRRATVAFRIILVVPHFLYLYVLQLVGSMTAVIAWVAAVFTGRMPEGIGDLLGNIVQYAVRVNAYLYLLTDVYPPFSLGAADYPVAVALPPRTKLHRGAVLFRIVIAVPVLFVIALVSEGFLLPMLVIWLILLVSARLPTAAFEAGASYLRYQTRFYAWFLMLTPEYPRGLFGDEPPPLLAASSESALPPPPPPPRVGQAGPPRITRLVLSRGAKWLLGVMVALGAIFLTALFVVSAVMSSETSVAQDHLDRDYGRVLDAEDAYDLQVQQCAISAGGLDCLHRADAALATRVRRFVVDIERQRYSEAAIDQAIRVHGDALGVADLLTTMSTTSDQGVYNGLARQYHESVDRLDDDEIDLYDRLSPFE